MSLPETKVKTILTAVFFVSLNLLATYYIKYSLNSISLAEFNIHYFGNLLNFLVSASIILALLIHFIQSDKYTKGFSRLVNFLLVIMVAGLAIVIFIDYSGLSLPDNYIFQYPFKKVFIGAILISNGLFQIFILVLLWNLLISKNQLLFIRSMFISALLVILLLVFSFVYTTSYKVDYELVLDKSKVSKYGVVLGAAVWKKDQPSTLFKGRIEKAAELYEKNILDKIQLTGGNAPGEISEAKAAYLYLEEKKIPLRDILIEENTSTTSEQVLYVKRQFPKIYSKKAIILISDHFHIKRVLEMCDFFNVKAVGVTSEYSLNWEKLLYYRIRDSVGLLLFWFFAI